MALDAGRRHWTFALVVTAPVVLGLGLAGCETAGFGAAGGSDASIETESPTADTASPAAQEEKRVSWGLYTPLFDQGDHLNKLIGNGELEAAAKLYVEQKEYFDGAQDKLGKDLKRLADALNEKEAPPLKEAIAKVDALTWPAPAADWPALGRDMEGALAALAKYPSHALLEKAAHRSPLADELESRLNDAAARIEADAPREFARFDHFGGGSFFDAYPSTLAAPAFLAENFAAIRPKLEAAGTDALGRFAATYSADTLGPDLWRQVGDMYVAAYLRAPGNQGPNELATILGAVRDAKDAGFEPESVPDLKIAFIHVTSRTLLSEGQIEFSAAVDIDLPVEAVKASLDDALSNPAAEGADYLVIFDVALAKTRRRVKGLDKKSSRYLAGHEKEPNPEYNMAQNELNLAQMELQNANMQSASTNAQFCQGLGCLGKMIGQIGGIALTAGARQKVEEAMAKMRATPMYIDKPIYAKYDYDVARISSSKTMTVNYYVIDRRKSTFFKSTFDVAENEDFQVAYRVHQEDNNKNVILNRNDTEDAVDGWERTPSTIRLSQLIDHYLANISEAKKLPPLATLRAEMLADKNVALLNYKEQTFEGSTEADPRFDSVVVIYMGSGGLGSGFFVRPDVVMTNYHVVKELKFAEMKLHDGRETFGKVMAKDVRLDLALIKVQSRGKPVEFFRENKLPLGSTVEVIGHPHRYEFAITRGIISAVRKMRDINIKSGKKVMFVQIDAPTSPGNSGGPVFLKDRVVSVVSFGNNLPGAENLNFTIHYSEALQFLEEALGTGS